MCVVYAMMTIVVFFSVLHISHARFLQFTVTSHSTKTESVGALLADFGPIPTNSFPGQLAHADPADACTQLNETDMLSNTILMVKQGSCSFVDKVINAQNFMVAAVIIVSNTSHLFVVSGTNTTGITVPVFMVRREDGETLKSWNQASVVIAEYRPPVFDIATLILFSMATICIFGGAYASSDVERARAKGQEPILNRALHFEEVVIISPSSALMFVALASIMLLLLFFFINYLIYVIFIAFGVVGTFALVLFFIAPLRQILPQRYDRKIWLPMIGPVNLIYLYLSLASSSMVLFWFIQRHTKWAWILQDFIGMISLIELQKFARLPNLKVSSLLLILVFFYDIFWVFLSGYIFKQSVMVAAATGGSSGETLPILLSVPLQSNIFGGSTMIGFGDIMLPGLFISFLMRFDFALNQSLNLQTGYSLIAIIGYVLGLFITDIAMIISKQGQPALLYLVPCTLGVVTMFAWRRNDLVLLWEGKAPGIESARALVSSAPSFFHSILDRGQEF